jgi:hypothetical protein
MLSETTEASIERTRLFCSQLIGLQSRVSTIPGSSHRFCNRDRDFLRDAADSEYLLDEESSPERKQHQCCSIPLATSEFSQDMISDMSTVDS